MKQMAKKIKEMKENLCMRQGVYLLGGEPSSLLLMMMMHVLSTLIQDKYSCDTMGVVEYVDIVT